MAEAGRRLEYEIFVEENFFPPSESGRIEDYEEYESRSIFHVITSDRDEVVGVVRSVLGTYESLPVSHYVPERWTEFPQLPVCEYTSLAIRPEHRKHGLAEELYRSVFALAWRSQLEGLVALVDPWMHELLNDHYGCAFAQIGPETDSFSGFVVRPIGVSLRALESVMPGRVPEFWNWLVEGIEQTDVVIDLRDEPAPPTPGLSRGRIETTASDFRPAEQAQRTSDEPSAHASGVEQPCRLVSIVDEPQHADAVLALSALWPEFVLQGPVGRRYEANVDRFLDWVLAVCQDGVNKAVGRVLAVPMRWDGPADSLPLRGWDAAIELALLDDPAPNVVCLLEITLAEETRGEGLSRAVLSSVKDLARQRGFGHLIAPVRPTGKSQHQEVPMKDYIDLRGLDGRLADPWLRLHLEEGGEIVGLAPHSVYVPGTFGDWHSWTGIDLSEAGDRVAIDGGLTPVLVDHLEESAVYIEPSVWVHYDLTAPQT
jgi:GNAT superfamily N-acetyltransferase